MMLRKLCVLLCCVPLTADAHGLFGHVHVTGWAIENLPPGELKDFFSDPEVFEAALSGAMYPDTGYAVSTLPSRAYGEHSHWEPFITDFVAYMRDQYGPTYDTLEERKLIAFMMGAASHGLQDELFDSTFMFEAEQRDAGSSQENLDPGTDGFLVQDGHARLYPGPYLPLSDLVPLYVDLAEAADITPGLIEEHVTLVRTFYVNDGVGITAATSLAEQHRPELPWASTHYLDPAVPGAHRAEILPTMRHMAALWDRLHDGLAEEDLVVHRWPEPGRRLREGDPDSVASWVTMVFGKGIVPDSATGSLTDIDGNPVDFELVGTRWGGTSRILRFQPREPLLPGRWYVATLDAGALWIDGTVNQTAHRHAFQVACPASDDPVCASNMRPFVPKIEPDEVYYDDTGAGDGGCDTGGAPGSWAAAALTLALIRSKRSYKQV